MGRGVREAKKIKVGCYVWFKMPFKICQGNFPEIRRHGRRVFDRLRTAVPEGTRFARARTDVRTRAR